MENRRNIDVESYPPLQRRTDRRESSIELSNELREAVGGRSSGAQRSDHWVHRINGHKGEQQFTGIPKRCAVLARDLLALLVGRDLDWDTSEQALQ